MSSMVQHSRIWGYMSSRTGTFCVAGESDTARSVVYTVCDGVPVEQKIGKVSDFFQQEDGSFVGMASSLDAGYSVAEQKTV